MSNTLTLQVWAQGDRTVGDGTFSAKVEFEMYDPELIPLAKESLAEAFGNIWDVAPRLVHIMTQAEFDEYTSDYDVEG